MKNNNVIKLKKVLAGHYQYKHYNLIKWIPDTGNLRYLWCLAIDGVGMDDFKTLAKAKQHILDQEIKFGNEGL
jgi:hypothetical protein